MDLVTTATYHDVATYTVVFHAFKALFAHGTAQIDCRQLLRDIGRYQLQGPGHGDKFTRLGTPRLTEIELHELVLQSRRLILAVVLREARDLLF